MRIKGTGIRKSAVHGEKNVCYYCGQRADSIDHVIPQDMLRMLAALSDISITRTILKNRALKAWACRECNYLLSDSLQQSLAERKYYLKTRLLRKYQRILDSPKWEPEEYEELGYVLRHYVETAQRFKEFIKQRINW